MKSDELKIGLKVRTLREFSGVPLGTLGTVIHSTSSWPETESVAVTWHRHAGDCLTDWFSFDELEFLEVAI